MDRRAFAAGIICLSVAAAIVFAAQPAAPTIEGKVVAVADGDTLTVLDGDKVQHKVRLEGIDAPEAGQAFGTQAKKSLSGRVFGEDVLVRVTGKDRYGRTLGHVYLGKEWVNRDLVLDGYAWHYKKYSSDAELAEAEKAARRGGSGLWADKEAIAPWDFRKGARAALESPPARAKAATDTIVYVTKSGSKYHREGCRSLAKSTLPLSLDNAKSKYAPCSICKPPR